MGTRARVNVIDGNKAILSIYRQFDGYPSGLGKEVADFAKKLTIVNGYSSDKAKTQSNGMGCFAASLVKYLKDGIGNVYIRDTSDESHGEEFSYDLKNVEGKVWMTIYKGSMTFFGNPGDTPSEMKHLWTGYTKDFDASKLKGAN
jgi:hypothetical protein